MTDNHSLNAIGDFRSLVQKVEAEAEARVNATLADLEREFEYPPFRTDGLNEPEFGKAGAVHDWRNYVPDAYKSRWGEFSYETKVAIYVMAEIDAHREEWD